jgi:hypothetical protein
MAAERDCCQSISDFVLQTFILRQVLPCPPAALWQSSSVWANSWVTIVSEYSWFPRRHHRKCSRCNRRGSLQCWARHGKTHVYEANPATARDSVSKRQLPNSGALGGEPPTSRRQNVILNPSSCDPQLDATRGPSGVMFRRQKPKC